MRECYVDVMKKCYHLIPNKSTFILILDTLFIYACFKLSMLPHPSSRSLRTQAVFATLHHTRKSGKQASSQPPFNLTDNA